MNARRQAIQELNENNYFFKRAGTNHDIYVNSETGYIIPVKRDFKDRDLKIIRWEIKKGGR